MSDDNYYYNIEDEEEDPEEVEERDPDPSSKPNLFGVLLKILMGPIEGWKSLRRARFTPEQVSAGLLWPLCGAAALSDFIAMIYDSHRQLSMCVTEALGTFLSFFLGYYLAGLFTRFLLPKAIRNFSETSFGKQFLMVGVSSLALFHILGQILPMLEPVLFFLPLWTAFIIVRGGRFIKTPVDRSSYTSGVLILVVIGAPILVNWCYSLI